MIHLLTLTVDTPEAYWLVEIYLCDILNIKTVISDHSEMELVYHMSDPNILCQFTAVSRCPIILSHFHSRLKTCLLHTQSRCKNVKKNIAEKNINNVDKIINV